jgi:hypothetical protein
VCGNQERVEGSARSGGVVDSQERLSVSGKNQSRGDLCSHNQQIFSPDKITELLENQLNRQHENGIIIVIIMKRRFLMRNTRRL